MTRTAIYPGTFDPLTLGHIDVIKKSLKLVDRLIVATTDNINKNYFFSIDERITIINPAIILSSYEFWSNTCPKKVDAAPKTIKTVEKPKVNKTIGIKFTFFFSINSLSELPEIYEIYPGIKGNTQGDKKLIKPAPNAINNSIIIFLL